MSISRYRMHICKALLGLNFAIVVAASALGQAVPDNGAGQETLPRSGAPSARPAAKRASPVKMGDDTTSGFLIMGAYDGQGESGDDPTQVRGLTWMRAQQACQDAGRAGLATFDDARDLRIASSESFDLMVPPPPHLWVGAAYIHSSIAPEPASSPQLASAWMWVTNTGQASSEGEQDAEPSTSRLHLTQHLPWAPGFPRLLGEEHVSTDGDSSEGDSSMLSCVAMQWSPEQQRFLFQNIRCDSNAVQYFVCQKQAAATAEAAGVVGQERPPQHGSHTADQTLSTGWTIWSLLPSWGNLFGPNTVALLIVGSICAAVAAIDASRRAKAAGIARTRPVAAAAADMPASRRMREAAAAAAAARAAAAAAAPAPVQTDVAVVRAMRAFGVEVTAMQDYLHYHPQKILDALRLLHSTADILVHNQGDNPKGSGQPFQIKATLFSERTHGVPHSYPALLMLGFKETVRDLQKYLEFRGRFHDDHDKNLEFLRQAAKRLQVAMESVEKHMQMNRPKYQIAADRRELELAAIRDDIEADRAARRAQHRADQAGAGAASGGARWEPAGSGAGPSSPDQI
eukprot:jgi/Ulvmu1/359/UM001_0365.1